MKLSPVTALNVGLDFGPGVMPVGRLAARDRRVYFEYDPGFVRQGLEISPLRLPLQGGVQAFEPAPFDGLAGVFNDSLPDGWGRLLFDRALRTIGRLPDEVSVLDRLAHVGTRGMGALVYQPDQAPDPGDGGALDLDLFSEQSAAVLEGEADDVLDRLIELNGSSTGARPKAMVGLHAGSDVVIHGRNPLPDGYEPWIVKFPNTQDGRDAGAIEYVYARMATSAGVMMSSTRLIRTGKGLALFATRRFDRDDDRRLHMHTVSGLLHSDHRTPALDYQDLLALTGRLTRDRRQIESMFRLAVFNVLAHNRDDHAKNFAFLMDEHGDWRLAPAYDLTFSSGPGGEQSMTVSGQGRRPAVADLLQLGQKAGLSVSLIQDIIDQTRSALGNWSDIAAEHGVSAPAVRLIADRIGRTDKQAGAR